MSKKVWGLGLMLAGQGLVLLASPDARACAANPPPGEQLGLAPFDGELGVPLNTRVYLGLGGPDRIILRVQETQTSVPFVLSDISGGRVLTPDALLAPDTKYEVEDNGTTLLRFTTGSTQDTTAPAIPTVKSERGEGDRPSPLGPLGGGPGSCGGGGIDGHVMYVMEVDGSFILVDYDESSTFDPVALDGNVSDIARTDLVYVYGSDAKKVRFGAVDGAGNFSGWSEFRDVNIPEDSGACACASPGKHSTWAGAAVLSLATVFLSRRRSRVRA